MASVCACGLPALLCATDFASGVPRAVGAKYATHDLMRHLNHRSRMTFHALDKIHAQAVLRCNESQVQRLTVCVMQRDVQRFGEQSVVVAAKIWPMLCIKQALASQCKRTREQTHELFASALRFGGRCAWLRFREDAFVLHEIICSRTVSEGKMADPTRTLSLISNLMHVDFSRALHVCESIVGCLTSMLRNTSAPCASRVSTLMLDAVRHNERWRDVFMRPSFFNAFLTHINSVQENSLSSFSAFLDAADVQRYPSMLSEHSEKVAGVCHKLVTRRKPEDLVCVARLVMSFPDHLFSFHVKDEEFVGDVCNTIKYMPETAPLRLRLFLRLSDACTRTPCGVATQYVDANMFHLFFASEIVEERSAAQTLLRAALRYNLKCV